MLIQAEQVSWYRRSPKFSRHSAFAAAATPGEWETNHNEWGEVTQDTCDLPGLTVRDEGSGDSRDRFVLRDNLPYFEGHSVDTDVYTDLATAESVSVVQKRNDRSTHVTDNGDGTLTVIYLASAVNVMYDQEGTVIDRGAGSVSVEAIWDHAGTPSDPDDDQPVAFHLLRSSGRDIDFCATWSPRSADHPHRRIRRDKRADVKSRTPR